ncbi:MAG: hypothetical protein IPH69_02570 [Bacteroidales bacterium]|nr:hypothetical protein [Bacteroidales bacterium]
MIRKYSIWLLLLFLSSCEPNADDDTSILRLYGDAMENIGYSVSKTDDGYVIGGQFTEIVREGNRINVDSSGKKLGIIRTDVDGKIIWKKSFGGKKVAVGSKVITLSDGSFAATGYIENTVNNLKDVFVVKVSADGSTFTQNSFGGTGNQFGVDLIQTDEGFMVLGSTDVARAGTADSIGNISGKRDIYLVRLNNNLELIGAPKAFGYPGNDVAVAIRSDVKNDKGGYIILGTTENNWPKQKLNNILVLKTNIYGEPSYGPRIIGSTDDEYATDIEILDDGYLISGIVGADGSDQSVYLLKIPVNIFSPIVYTKKFKVTTTSSTATSFAVRAINKYGTDSFVMAGQAGTGSSAKMLIFVTDAEGNQVAGKDMITTATGVQIAYDVVTDENNDIVVVGKNSFENNSMISLFKVRF